jgi:hypothetical protein
VDVIDPGQAGENQVMARFLAYLDDAPWFPRYRLSAVGRPRQARVSVGALGVDYEVHGSERSYLRARRAAGGGRRPGELGRHGVRRLPQGGQAPEHADGPGVLAY